MTMNVLVQNVRGRNVQSNTSGGESSWSKKSGGETSWSKTLGCETTRSDHDWETSWVSSMIVTLPVISLWLLYFLWPLWWWNFLGPLFDCETSWSLLMIAMLPVPLMIVILPVPLYDCNTSWAFTSWLCNFLYNCDTPWGFLIVRFFYYHFILNLIYDSLIGLTQIGEIWYCDCEVLLFSFKFDLWLVNWFDIN